MAWTHVSPWIEACERMLELDVDVVVPGHGPVTDKHGIAEVRDYLSFVRDEARNRWESGMDPVSAASDIALGRYASLGQPGRIVANVAAVYREFDSEQQAVPHEVIWENIAINENWSADSTSA
jgi:glyoxylase-like metal-dependent hydrolase (beta-lactamase superfamily II)